MREEQRTEPGQALALLARRQHGVVSIRQLERLGFDKDWVTRAVRQGRLHRLYRGVYAVGHRRLSWEGHCLAAVLACAPAAVASHATAGWLWGILRSRPERFDVTAATRRHPKSPIRIHYADLTEADRAVRDNIPTTSLPRTFLDLASSISPDRLEKSVEQADKRGLLDLRPIDALLARCSRHSGVSALRQVLAIYRPDPAVTRAGTERLFRKLAEEAGLRPSMNFVAAGYELDAYWEAERFGVELEVYATHGSRAAFERDGARQEDLMLLGIETIRISGPRLEREPRA
ncbi:MAG TPA: type IV toxin-antitoxin system AbiEi family antitoxin domain-containing protein, partial [Solirubrobacterales bacterium]